MNKEVIIFPTRLEGQGRIRVLLEGDQVERAYFQVSSVRGFERLCEGRQAEYLPQLTSRISGFSSWAYHLATAKALDGLFQVEPSPAAKKVRELLLNISILDHHLFHLFYLSGPDLFLNPQTPKLRRNLFNLVTQASIDPELRKQVFGLRKELRGLLLLAGGKVINPVLSLPGGITKPLTNAKRFQAAAGKALEFALRLKDFFKERVLANSYYMELLKEEAYIQRTYYMGLVDPQGRLNFYDGLIRVVDPEGEEFVRFPAQEYPEQLARHVEPWSYQRFLFLKRVGWKGFTDGPDSGIFTVGPLGRLNASLGLATPQAEAAREEFHKELGRPVHSSLAADWARLIELIYAAERIGELSQDPEILEPEVRRLPGGPPEEGFGAVEAPEGTVIHHFRTDEEGIVLEAELLLPAEANAGRLNLAIDQAAKAFFSREGKEPEWWRERVVLPLRSLGCQGG